MSRPIRNWGRMGLAVVALAATLTLPAEISPYYVQLATIGLMWVILNEGLNIVLGFMGYVSLAQGALFGIAAYIVAITTTQWSMNIWVAAGIAIVGTLLVAFLVGLLVFRTAGHYYAIITLSFSFIFEELFVHLAITDGSQGISGIPSLIQGPLAASAFYYGTLVLAALSVAVVLLLRTSRFGYALRSIRDNERLASSVGVNLLRYKILAFMVSALFAAVVGILYASYLTFVSPSPFDTNASLESVLAVVLGGAGNTWGPVIGSFFVVLFPSILEKFQVYEFTIYGLAVILVIQYLPGGIVQLPHYFKVGLTRITRVVSARRDAAPRL